MAADSPEQEWSEDEVGRWLHEGLTPGEEQVRRVVSRALDAAQGRGGSTRSLVWPLAAGFLAVFALAGTVFFLSQKADMRTRHPAQDPSQVERITITNASGEVELILPAGTRLPRRPPLEAPSERRVCNAIYNRGSVVVLAVCNGDPHYWISGGEP